MTKMSFFYLRKEVNSDTSSHKYVRCYLIAMNSIEFKPIKT